MIRPIRVSRMIKFTAVLHIGFVRNVAVFSLASLLAACLQAGDTRQSDRQKRLYVTDKTGISVYDIDHGHRLLKKIDVPESGDYKGIAASVQLGKLYVTSYKKDDLICLDLKTDKVDWRKHLGAYADSMQITPDGKRMYLPFRDEDFWQVVDTATGNVVTTIHTEHGKNYDVHPIGNPVGPHNTWLNRDGTRAYLEVLTVPYVRIVDTSTNQIIGKVGPFAKGVRPFAVTEDEKLLYANVDGLLGFSVGRVQENGKWGGPALYSVETTTPPERLKQMNMPAHRPHSTPSHGINIRPDQKEVWIADSTFGYIYVFSLEGERPKQIATIPLFQDPKEQPHPGWISFSIDGKYAYPDGGAVIDATTKQIVARIPTSEKLLEVDFSGDKPIEAGRR
jgi:DNA-binding beta-propeller fold protein YncE